MSNELNSGSDPGTTTGLRDSRSRASLRSGRTDWFEGLAIRLTDNGDTLLTSSVVETAALHGALKKCGMEPCHCTRYTRVKPDQAKRPETKQTRREFVKAVVYTKYGLPDVLHIQEVAKPTPKDDEVLIKVAAVSVNRSDWETLTGKPLYARIGGLLKPRHQILGSDVAGRVELAGRNIRQFHPEDEVFGHILTYTGGFAEYVCVPENALALKPASMTFEEVAAIPEAGFIALQGIRDKGQVQPGQTVLINGAGGGAGTFAVQLAKFYGAEVTGVDHTGKLDFLRSLGADHVIDYTREDFTKNGKQYDLILDLVAHRSVFAYRRALRPNGRYFMVGGSVATIFQILLLGPWMRRTGGKNIRLLVVQPNPKDSVFLTELCEAGKVVPMIDRRYPLREVALALRYLGEGHAKGKVVITVEQNDNTEHSPEHSSAPHPW